jgi:ABC-type antimicrobial peptide transport system permease subunit
MMLYMSYGDTDTGPDSHTLATQLHADGRDLQKVLGFRMRQGRYFNASDTRTSQPVAVVNQTFVNLWSKSGKSLDEFPLSLAKDKKRKIRIIGVIDDVRQISLAEPPAPEIDLCADQLLPDDTFYNPTMRAYAEIAIRTTVPIEQIAPDIRAAMAAVDPALKGSVVETMQQVVNDNIGDQLFAAHLLETFGGCALLVALTGLYGFLAYLVSQRTHDIGVRLALGAQRASIQWMFLARALAMIAAGLAAGVLVSLFATRLVTRFLYGVRPNDLATLVGVVLVILTAGLVAAWLPARLASNVEPMEALREA